MKTLIIAGFPGVGKSYLKKKLGSSVSDSDSSKFPKDEFPNNYIEHIKGLIDKKRIVMVSTHKEVLKGLEDENIPYILVHPTPSQKIDYLERYKQRGSPQSFIDLLDNNWVNFMNDIYDANPKIRIELKNNEFLKDGLKKL